MAAASASNEPRLLAISSSSPYHARVMEKLEETQDFDFSDRREELSKIGRGENRVIEVLMRDNLPLGALVYKTHLDDQYERLGSCLAVRAILPFNPNNGETGIDTRLVERAIEVARGKLARGIYVKTVGDNAVYKMLGDYGFATSRVWLQERNIRLMHRSVDRLVNGAQQHSQRSSHEDRKRGADRQIERDTESKRARPANVRESQQQQRTPTVHSIPLRNPYLGQIKTGQKTIEGRINSGLMLRLREGDRIRFHNQSDSVACEITRITRHASFEEMLTEEGVEKCLPGLRSVREGVAIYDRIPQYPQKAARFGVLAIAIKLIQ